VEDRPDAGDKLPAQPTGLTAGRAFGHRYFKTNGFAASGLSDSILPCPAAPT